MFNGLPGTYERCMRGHFYAVVRGDEECPICERISELESEVARLIGANRQLRAINVQPGVSIDLLARWQDACGCTTPEEAKARIAELQADKNRLDWLDCQRALSIQRYRENECLGDVITVNGHNSSKLLRQAIDIAVCVEREALSRTEPAEPEKVIETQ